MIRIIVDSLDKNNFTYLRSELKTSDYQFVSVDSYSPFNVLVKQIQPQIVIFDHIHKRHVLVRSRIKLLKELCPNVRIIVVSHEPSKQDAEVVELGVFYYQCGTDGLELKRVIQAAVDSITGQRSVSKSSEAQS